MPQDLESKMATMSLMAPLTKEPEHGAPPASDQQTDKTKPTVQESMLNQLHPYVQVLNLNDLDSIVNLENATFPRHEACSREKSDSPTLQTDLDLDDFTLAYFGFTS